MSDQPSGDLTTEQSDQRQSAVGAVSATAIEAELRAALPRAAQHGLPELAQVLAAVADRTVQPDDAAATLAANPKFVGLLSALTGHTVEAAGVPLQFDRDQITVGNVNNSEATAVGRGAVAIKLTIVNHPRPSALTPQQQRNRQKMLAKVQRIWIDGVLKHSLYQEVLIALGLQEAPDAVSRPLDVQVRYTDQPPAALPSGTRVREIYARFDETLLILGAPGAGKTTLLLELTRDLLQQARDDEAHPIPVVFPLASWAASRRPLADWLVDELHARYDVPLKIAQGWVAEEWILPLLDGLDEVAPAQRADCVAAINQFRQAHGLLPLVVCSRSADYTALTIKLRLEGAIVVRPLSREQARHYLRAVGLKVLPSSQSLLWEVLDTPLLLNIAVLTYAGQNEPTLASSLTAEGQRDQLFAAYVERMFERKALPTRTTPQQATTWLAWLAWQMQHHSQPILYLEHLQRNWLSISKAHQQYDVLQRLGVGLLGGLLYGSAFGLFGWLGSGMGYGFGYNLVGALLGGLAGGLLGGIIMEFYLISEPKPVEDLQWSWSRAWAGMRGALPFGFGVAPLVGWAGWLKGWGLRGTLIYGLVFGLGSGLVGGLSSGLTSREIPNKTRPNQGIRRSAQRALLTGLFLGLGGVLIFVLGGWLLFGEPRSGLFMGLLIGLAGGLVGGLQYGGHACLSHIALRLVLWRSGAMPLRYVRFLDESADRILLRRVGGGYSFVHRLLLDWFANQYTGPETQRPPALPPPRSGS